jgi:undecaprenyl-diphosphatase
MDLVLYLKALLLGTVEGLTEFLPISSTGHQIIVGDWLNFNDEKGKAFEIAIQLGAILAVCFEYRGKLIQVVQGAVSQPVAQRFIGNLLIAFLPAAVLGFLLYPYIMAHLFQPHTVALALIVGGVVILGVEALPHQPRLQNVDELEWKDAFKVGLAQTAALIPGVSRAGATIVGGLLFGFSRTAATEFSFFLAIPTMFAATFYVLYKSFMQLNTVDYGVFALGFMAAFVSALFAVRALLHYIAHHNFRVFAWYRIIFGLIVLYYYS